MLLINFVRACWLALAIVVTLSCQDVRLMVPVGIVALAIALTLGDLSEQKLVDFFAD